MEAELCIGVPTPHYKYQVQYCVIVWGGEEAIKDWKCALMGRDINLS